MDCLENIWVENGVLKIEVCWEIFIDQGYIKEFILVCLNFKFIFQYGWVEICVKLFIGFGIWLVFWMLGKNIDEDGGYWDNEGFGIMFWLVCGEIDIMEYWGINFGYVFSVMYMFFSFGGMVNVGG